MFFTFVQMPWTRHIAASILMIVILCPLLIYTTLSFHKHLVKWQMEERLEHAALKTISLKKDAFTWVKINKEIVVNGRLFDVKSYVNKDENIIFKGLYDDEEKEIIHGINSLVHNKKNSSSHTFTLFKIMLIPLIINERTHVTAYNSKKVKAYYYTYNEVAISQYNSIYLPPPNS